MSLILGLRTPLPEFPHPKRGRPALCKPYTLVQMLADGKSIVDVSKEFKVHVDTVKIWLNRLRKQHNVNTLPQLVAHYLRNGWVD